MKKRLVLFLVTSLLIGLATTSFAAPVVDQVKVGLSKDLIYFVFPDRYLNGDTTNDSFPGYNPKDTAFFHGGDLKGLTGTCSDGDNG